MRIVKFIIENYKAMRGRKEFNPDGASFMLLGSNGKGKTSAGRALMDILTNNIPSKPVTTGENKGMVEFTFDDGRTILARFSEDGTKKIELLSKDGLKMESPKAVLQNLAGSGMHFDIDSFLSMAPKPRRELLEKIAGIDLTSLNALEKEKEEARRVANAEAKAAEARVKPYDEALAEKDIVDTATAVSLLKEMTEANAARDRVEAGIKQRGEKVLELQQKIKELQEQEETIANEIAKGIDWLKSNKGYTDNEVVMQEDLINKADKIREAKQLRTMEQEANKLKAIAAKIDQEIKNIRTAKDNAIKTAKLPAEGLAFDPGTDNLLIDGLPFEDNQLAASRKLIVAVQIAASMLGEIKYLHFDGASLDRASADTILEWAEKNDLQLCLERPLWEGGEEVKMEIIEPDTEVVENNVKTKKAAIKKEKVQEEKVVSQKINGNLPW